MTVAEPIFSTANKVVMRMPAKEMAEEAIFKGAHGSLRGKKEPARTKRG